MSPVFPSVTGLAGPLQLLWKPFTLRWHLRSPDLISSEVCGGLQPRGGVRGQGLQAEAAR